MRTQGIIIRRSVVRSHSPLPAFAVPRCPAAGKVPAPRSAAPAARSPRRAARPGPAGCTTTAATSPRSAPAISSHWIAERRAKMEARRNRPRHHSRPPGSLGRIAASSEQTLAVAVVLCFGKEFGRLRQRSDTSSDPLAPWRSRYRAGSPWPALFLRAHDLAQ